MAGVLQRHPKKIAAGAAAVTAIYFADYLPNPMRTYGVENIEKRMTSGGGSPTHTPAVSSKLGSEEHAVGNQQKSKGVGTPTYEDRIGDQRPEGGRVSRKLYEASYGTTKGK